MTKKPTQTKPVYEVFCLSVLILPNDKAAEIAYLHTGHESMKLRHYWSLKVLDTVICP